jgi:carbonic anhydrase
MSETRLRGLATEPLESNYIPSLQQTTPQVLWIGCSDSNFKECTMLNILDDELLVLRNMGNMIIDGDLSCDTTIRHAVVDLQVVLAPKIIASSFVYLV